MTFSLPLTGTWNTPSTRWHSTDWTGARWLQRAAELETEEKAASKRHPSTSKKRLRLTSEILQSLGYEDLEVLELLQEGSTLADDIEASAVFQSAFKPCVSILQQLEDCAAKRDLLVLGMTKSSGSVGNG